MSSHSRKPAVMHHRYVDRAVGAIHVSFLFLPPASPARDRQSCGVTQAGGAVGIHTRAACCSHRQRSRRRSLRCANGLRLLSFSGHTRNLVSDRLNEDRGEGRPGGRLWQSIPPPRHHLARVYHASLALSTGIVRHMRPIVRGCQPTQPSFRPEQSAAKWSGGISSLDTGEISRLASVALLPSLARNDRLDVGQISSPYVGGPRHARPNTWATCMAAGSRSSIRLSRVAGGTAWPSLRQEGISSAAVGGHWLRATQLGAFHLEGVVRIVDEEAAPVGW
jgi:hypothetical protein